jgi:hypothetical protein
MTVTTVHDRVAIGKYTGAPIDVKDIARRKAAAGDKK